MATIIFMRMSRGGLPLTRESVCDTRLKFPVCPSAFGAPFYNRNCARVKFTLTITMIWKYPTDIASTPEIEPQKNLYASEPRYIMSTYAISLLERDCTWLSVNSCQVTVTPLVSLFLELVFIGMERRIILDGVKLSPGSITLIEWEVIVRRLVKLINPIREIPRKFSKITRE